MVVKIGGVSIKIELDDVELKKLVGMIASQDLVMPQLEKEEIESLPEEAEEKPPVKSKEDLTLLKDLMGSHTLVMIARKVLGIDTTGKTIDREYPFLAEKAEAWITRPIRETFSVLYISRIGLPVLGTCIAVVGLNTDNQQVILSLEPTDDVKTVFKGLIGRGLRVSNIRLGVIGLDKDIEKEFCHLFPKANVARCWTSVIDAAPAELRPEIKSLSTVNNLKDLQAKIKRASPGVKSILNPTQVGQLTAYFDFEKKLWRVLRIMTPIYRLQFDLKAKLRNVPNEHVAKIITTWSCIRLQYHWRKYSVDAAPLSNLRYMKKQPEAVLTTTAPSKRNIRRRPAELLEEDQ